MRYVDTETEALVWPEQSITGFSGQPLLDTGWDLNWAGPGRVYLDDRDACDILSACLGRPLVVEMLVGRGWTAPGDTAERVAELERQNGNLSEQLEAAHIEAAGLFAALRRLAPDEVVAGLTANCEED